MTELSPREVVDRYARAVKEREFEAAPSLLADDIVEDYPQSGERIEGLDNWMAIMRHWPDQDRMASDVDRVVGSEDKWVVGPSWALTRVVGTGEEFWATGHVTYPDGSTWHLVQLIRVRDGKISHLTSYFAEPFEAAEWRRPWVTHIPDAHR